MDNVVAFQTLLPALTAFIAGSAALGGALIGGLVSYRIKRLELRQALLLQEVAKRENLFSAYFAELSRLNYKIMNHNNPVDLSPEILNELQALLSQMRMSSGEPVVLMGTQALANVVRHVAERTAPPFPLDLAEACRNELDELRAGLK